MSAVIPASQIKSAESIPPTNAEEAQRLLTTAFDRFINLIESLDPADWSRPTPCTAWDVHDMVAHQAGGYRSGISYREMFVNIFAFPKRDNCPKMRSMNCKWANGKR